MHRLEDIHKSAYWTLNEAGAIKHLEFRTFHTHFFRKFDVTDPRPDLNLYGFPWGTDPEYVVPRRYPHTINLAIIHDYCWIDGHAFPGSPQSKHADQWAVRLRGYHAAHFGDNHKGFLHPRQAPDRPVIVNTGTLTRRRTDEEDYHPRVGLLRSDGSIFTTGLGISKDKFNPSVKFDMDTVNEMDITFIEFLNEIQDVAINFKQTMFRFFNAKKVPKEVREVILKVMEDE